MMAIKTLDELLASKPTALPKYLIVKVGQMGYHNINDGQEVFETDAKGIKKMELDENNELKATDYVVMHDSVKDRIIYIQNTNKNPYIGKGAVEVDIASGDTAVRAMLEMFTEFAKGRYEFGVTIFYTDLLADVEESAPEEDGEG